MNILLVDDHDDIREIYETFLTTYFDCNIVQAESGNSAISQLKRDTPFDIIVSDYHMPNGDGGVLFDYVKELHPNTPFVLFSSDIGKINTDSAFANFFELNHFHTIISKPCSGPEFSYVIGNIYDKLNQTKEKFNLERKHQRYNIVVDACLKTPTSNDKTIFTKVINLSNGGMFVRFDDFCPEVNSTIDFKFISGHLCRKNGQGIVKWTRPSKDDSFLTGCGIEFLDK